MNATEATTRPASHVDPALQPTEPLGLPAAALLRDARRAAALELGTPPGQDAADEAPLHAADLVGHEFLDCVERGPFGEVWKVRAPDGRLRLAHRLTRVGPVGAWLPRLFALKHPALPETEPAWDPAGHIVLLTAAPDRTLDEWFKGSTLGGLPGIPRSELLGCLAQVAEALDELFRAHGLQHLGLHPGAVQLHGGRVLVGGFGLVPLLGLPSGRSARALNPHYAAPELLEGRMSTACDQYSLALIYAEMLTGVHPLPGLAPPSRPDRCPPARRRSAAEGPGRSGRLELGLLSAADREVVARALSPDPKERFPNCVQLVRALQAIAHPETSPPPRSALLPRLLITTAERRPSLASLDQFIHELMALGAGPLAVREYGAIRYRLEPGEALRHRCAASLFPGAALLKLEGFRQEWGAEAVLIGRDCFVFSVRTPPSFWERLTGREVGLEIQVQMAPPARANRKLSEVAVVIRPYGCGQARAVRLLEEFGPVLLGSLRTHLQVPPELRRQERLLWNQPLRVIPVVGSQVADAIECMGKDVSVRGIGFFLPQPLAATHVYVNHPSLPQLAAVAGLARVVRGQRCPDGWYEVGALFTPENPE